MNRVTRVALVIAIGVVPLTHLQAQQSPPCASIPRACAVMDALEAWNRCIMVGADKEPEVPDARTLLEKIVPECHKIFQHFVALQTLAHPIKRHLLDAYEADHAAWLVLYHLELKRPPQSERQDH